MFLELKLVIKNVLRAVQKVVNQPVAMGVLEVVRVLVLANAVGSVQIIVAEVVVIFAQIIVTYGAVMVVSKVVRAVVRIAVKMVAKEVQNVPRAVLQLVHLLALEAVLPFAQKIAHKTAQILVVNKI